MAKKDSQKRREIIGSPRRNGLSGRGCIGGGLFEYVWH